MPQRLSNTTLDGERRSAMSQSPLPLDGGHDLRHHGAPWWIAPMSAWAGALSLCCALALPWIASWRRSTGAVQRGHWTSGDLWAPIPVYIAVLAVVLGTIILWQTRAPRRSHPAPMINHRVQAWTGIMLGGIAVALIYLYVFVYVAWKALKA